MDYIMNKKIIFLFFISFLLFNLFPDETDDTIQVPSLEKYKEILTFGIEEEVVNILNNFGNSPGSDIYTLISDRYKEALLPNTKIAIIRYFSKCTNLPDNIIAMLLLIFFSQFYCYFYNIVFPCIIMFIFSVS